MLLYNASLKLIKERKLSRRRKNTTFEFVYISYFNKTRCMVTRIVINHHNLS